MQYTNDAADCGTAASRYKLFTQEDCTAMPLLSFAVVVPDEHSYPADFLAEVRSMVYATTELGAETKGRIPVNLLIVLERQSARDPWKLAFRTTWFDGPEAPFLQVPETNGGYDPTSPPPGPTLPSLLAHYYQTCWTSGKPPAGSLFITGAWTTGWCKQMQSVHQANKTVVYSVDPARNGAWDFRVGVSGYVTGVTDRQPWWMVCSAIDVTVTNEPTAGNSYIVQTFDEIQFGPELEPGVYSKVVSYEDHEDCILSDVSSLSVIGTVGTIYKAVGLPSEITAATSLR